MHANTLPMQKAPISSSWLRQVLLVYHSEASTLQSTASSRIAEGQGSASSWHPRSGQTWPIRRVRMSRASLSCNSALALHSCPVIQTVVKLPVCSQPVCAVRPRSQIKDLRQTRSRQQQLTASASNPQQPPAPWAADATAKRYPTDWLTDVQGKASPLQPLHWHVLHRYP